MSKIIVAIDGPAGAGKSTTARGVAEVLGYVYLDTGAMYRAVALRVITKGGDPDDAAAAIAAARVVEISFRPGDPQRVVVDGADVTEAIRTADVSDAASRVARHPEVRGELVERQQLLGQAGGVVLEGRDTTTVVFPDAQLKVFLDATVRARARRRQTELAQRGDRTDLKAVADQIRARDDRDRHTQERFGPWPPQDAIRVDTTGLTIEDQIARVAALARERGAS